MGFLEFADAVTLRGPILFYRRGQATPAPRRDASSLGSSRRRLPRRLPAPRDSRARRPDGEQGADEDGEEVQQEGNLHAQIRLRRCRRGPERRDRRRGAQEGAEQEQPRKRRGRHVPRHRQGRKQEDRLRRVPEGARSRANPRARTRRGERLFDNNDARASPAPVPFLPPGRRETLERPPPPPPRAPHASSASRAPSSHATRSPSHAVLSTTDRPTDRPTDPNALRRTTATRRRRRSRT